MFQLKHTPLIIALFAFCFLAACKKENRAASSVMFGPDEDQVQPEDYDLADMQATGELIAVTLSGPDTYYEYRGQGFGLQFAMCEAFARSVGARLRMEMAADTASLFRQLLSGEADMIALELNDTALLHYAASDARLLDSRWVVRSNADALAQAVNSWWKPGTREQFLAAEATRTTSRRRVQRHAQPSMLSRSNGTISRYDNLFVRHAQAIGWDWRLLAAQCYQESGFDPQATSWAGACGLMQLMPATAERMGFSRADINDPSTNIEAAVRYISQLNNTFSDIPNSQERIFFILAAYNGGAGHVRDAMALAAQAGHQSTRWATVEPYILALSDPQTYRQPIVRYGYLRGQETVDYVRQIRRRWAAYRGVAGGHSSGRQAPTKRKRPSRVRPRTDYTNEP